MNDNQMSGGNLVIVESPAKARTISRLLGGSYNVAASMGHVRDLPEHALGVNIEKDFTPVYEIYKRNVITQLKQAAAGVQNIYLASDPDREGEAIAWHLQEILKGATKAVFKRVVFHEITTSAVKKAFETPGSIDMNLVNSQQARRILDRLVGYQISRFLWSKIEKGLSAGRVQSVALRLVCEREREILAFKPQEYWNFFVEFELLPSGSGKKFKAKLFTIDGNKINIGNIKDANAVLEAVKNGGNFTVSDIEIKPKKRYAPPPFITSTLQQSAAYALRFSASHTMSVAQQLYEGVELGSAGAAGLITYMRTDSVTVAKEAQEACRKFILSNIGQEYLPQYPNQFKSNARAQEAHEAIRPTNVNLTPQDAAQYISGDNLKLYTLIWKRFVASQMKPCETELTVVDVSSPGTDGKEYKFRSVRIVTIFPGFTKIYEVQDSGHETGEGDEELKDENAPSVLNELKKNQQVLLKDSSSEQKFTEPPPRFSEAMLIKELEANGIGRPSTYATILSTVLKRRYVIRNKGRLTPTELGFKLNDLLVGMMPELFQVGFTAEMESKLDDIEIGKVQWTAMLKDFYSSFSKWLENAKDQGMPAKEKAEALLSQFDRVREWKAPVKGARGRTYNDKKFVESVKTQFAAKPKISERQWNALISLAAQYKDQMPDLDNTAEEFGFKEDIRKANVKIEAVLENKLSAEESEILIRKQKMVVNILKGVKFAEAVKRRGRTFDDAKFVKSITKQLDDGGRPLSDKQLNAIKTIAEKYSAQIPEFEKLALEFDIRKKQPAESATWGKVDEKQITELVEKLRDIQEWETPVSKGRRNFDDKAFYASLAEQFKNKKSLSPKQISALKKLADKYSKDKEHN